MLIIQQQEELMNIKGRTKRENKISTNFNYKWSLGMMFRVYSSSVYVYGLFVAFCLAILHFKKLKLESYTLKSMLMDDRINFLYVFLCFSVCNFQQKKKFHSIGLVFSFRKNEYKWEIFLFFGKIYRNCTEWEQSKREREKTTIQFSFMIDIIVISFYSFLLQPKWFNFYLSMIPKMDAKV